jgi:hypothetical protein
LQGVLRPPGEALAGALADLIADGGDQGGDVGEQLCSVLDQEGVHLVRVAEGGDLDGKAVPKSLDLGADGDAGGGGGALDAAHFGQVADQDFVFPLCLQCPVVLAPSAGFGVAEGDGIRVLRFLRCKPSKLLLAGIRLRRFLDRSKTVTRPLGGQFLTPGTVLMGCKKCMGLKPGEKIERFGLIRVVSVRREPLDAIDVDDVRHEGFGGMSPRDFVRHFCRNMGCAEDQIVTRIECEHLPDRDTGGLGDQHSQGPEPQPYRGTR